MKQNSFCKDFLDAYNALVKSLGSEQMLERFPCLLQDFDRVKRKMKITLTAGLKKIIYYDDNKLIAEEVIALNLILKQYPDLCENLELNILKILSVATDVDADLYSQEVEDIMRHTQIEKFLDENAWSSEVQLLFAHIMQNTVKISCNSLAFTFGYKIFIDWLPLWQDRYPQVIEAVAAELRRMESKKKIRTSEERELYNLYNFEHQIV